MYNFNNQNTNFSHQDSVPNERGNIELNNMRQNSPHQNQNNNQTDNFGNQNHNYNYPPPPMMGNPSSQNNENYGSPQQNQGLIQKSPQFDQNLYIDFQMPQMHQQTSLKNPLEPSHPLPHQGITDFGDEEQQMNRNQHQIPQFNGQQLQPNQNGYQNYSPNAYPQQYAGQPYQQNGNVNQPYTPNGQPTPYAGMTPYNNGSNMFVNPDQVNVDIPPNQIGLGNKTQSVYNQDKRIGRLDSLKPKDKKKKKTFVKQNTVSHHIVQSSNHHVYYFVDTPTYHQNDCCCRMLFIDDCCLKWMCDLFFQLVFLPFRLLALLIRGLGSLCCSESSKNCYEGFRDFFYVPFRCCGEWVNQCWFSCTNFCCKGLDFMPGSVSQIFTNPCQKCCLQTGQFCKNCCSFPLNCNCQCLDNCPDCTTICQNSKGDCCLNNACHNCGDCCQHCCSPQGFFEDCFKCCINCTGNIVNKDCMQCVCCCCVELQKIHIDDQIVEIFKCCCCCILETVGKILGDILK